MNVVGVGVAFMVTFYINVNITICRGRGSQRTAATPMIIIFNWFELVFNRFELVFNWFELVKLVYGPFWQSKLHRTLDFCKDQSERNQMYQSLRV